MEARVICHPCLHQHTEQEWNKDQCLFEGLERLCRAGKSFSPKTLGNGICLEQLSISSWMAPPPTHRPSGLPGGVAKPLPPNSGLDKRPKMISAKTS